MSVKGPFTLKFINNRVSRCQGCKGLLKCGSVLPLPFGSFMTPEKSVKTPKIPSNSHYHLRMECLLAVDPGFKSKWLSISMHASLATPTGVQQKISTAISLNIGLASLHLIQ